MDTFLLAPLAVAAGALFEGFGHAFHAFVKGYDQSDDPVRVISGRGKKIPASRPRRVTKIGVLERSDESATKETRQR